MNTQSTPPPSGKRNKTVALLNDLKRKARDWDEAQKQKRNKTSADTSTSENLVREASHQQPGLRTSADDGLPQMTNPLLTPSSKLVVDHQGRKLCGPRALTRSPTKSRWCCFNIELPSMKETDLVVNIEGLPSLDYALYLTNTVKFHIVQTHHLFDEQRLMPALHSLYNDGPPLMTAGKRMWPILMCILRDKLEKSRHDNNANAEITEPVKALSLDLLELFLPFDLDHAFSAGFVLALISTIQPLPDAASESSFELTRNILDALAAGWNLPARFRRQELERHHNMWHLIEQRDIVPQLQGQADIPVLGEQGISANQILNVASLLDGHTNLGADLDDVNGWLWEVTGFEGLHSV
ncbi:hypothetical protein FPRO05_13146 [Fusarium proliferatum]|uniref:Uncharacterized protein n=1 Tax=Gibberella intermedia TaxID=948311 RepID=A0A365N2A6_GIBIN|nr:hypothetical protein FPRO05_13146 [Fusarium proliferatum]